jgi:hypothetical protein
MTFEDGKEDVHEWLAANMRTGNFSLLLLEELAWHKINRTIHVHAVFDEIGYLEDPSHRPTGTKKAGRLKASLRGFWHKHWFEPGFLATNLLNYARTPEAWPIFERMSDAINRGEYPAKCVHELVIGGHERRAGIRTGEWIMFAKIDKANYYLTLATHDEGRCNPDAIRERIRSCAVEFPQIMPLIPPPGTT